MKTPNELLDESIQLLEAKRDLEVIQLKLELNELVESLKPINIIKDTLKKVTNSTDIKEGIGKTAIGLASGLLVKNILFRGAHGPLKSMARNLMQIVTTGFVAKNAENLKTTAQKLFHGLISKIKR